MLVYPLEKIKWMDHSGFEELKWRTIEEVQGHTAIFLSTVGWVIHETDDIVVVVSTIEPDGDRCHSDFCIIKDAIISRQVIDE